MAGFEEGQDVWYSTGGPIVRAVVVRAGQMSVRLKMVGDGAIVAGPDPYKTVVVTRWALEAGKVYPRSDGVTLHDELEARRAARDADLFAAMDSRLEEALESGAPELTDKEAMDQIAEFLNREGDWSGADVCQFLNEVVPRTGRRVLELEEKG